MTSLREVLRPDQVTSSAASRRVYRNDAYTVERNEPETIVFPESTAEVSAVVKWCNREKVPFTCRGAGTGLSGGAMPALGGVIISTKRMTRILQVDVANRLMKAQAGTVNLRMSEAVKADRLHFAPDPSSQSVSTLGGNIAENSGGPHTLKYGVTAQHILGLTMVDSMGEVVVMGGPCGAGPGLDLMSLVVGSEGTVGVVTEAWVKLTPIPEHLSTATFCFPSVRAASEGVAGIVAAGVVPAALEMMDRRVLDAVREAFGVTFPDDTAAMLLVECDGPQSKSEAEMDAVFAVCASNGAIESKRARDETERQKLWTARKKGVGALGRVAPSHVTHDGVIPPSKLPEMLEFVAMVADEKGLIVANLFHAGDGNLHPIFCFDEREPGVVERVVEAGELIIGRCLELGGSVTGEHGVGVEKASLLTRMYSPDSMRLQMDARDLFHRNPLCNPCKVIPDAKGCVEHKLRWRGTAT
jgi:glycolate oxidase